MREWWDQMGGQKFTICAGAIALSFLALYLGKASWEEVRELVKWAMVTFCGANALITAAAAYSGTDKPEEKPTVKPPEPPK